MAKSNNSGWTHDNPEEEILIPSHKIMVSGGTFILFNEDNIDWDI